LDAIKASVDNLQKHYTENKDEIKESIVKLSMLLDKYNESQTKLICEKIKEANDKIIIHENTLREHDKQISNSVGIKGASSIGIIIGGVILTILKGLKLVD
jgi:hypothetical protein